MEVTDLTVTNIIHCYRYELWADIAGMKVSVVAQVMINTMAAALQTMVLQG